MRLTEVEAILRDAPIHFYFLTMLATNIQRKAVLNLLDSASTGNEILTILDWFVSTLSEPQPTLV